jgi:ATP adenylyltransferase
MPGAHSKIRRPHAKRPRPGPPAAAATLRAMAVHERFERGSLAAAIASRAERALSEGALLPIPTHARVIEDGGIPFVVRVLAQPAHKQAARAAEQAAGANPFLPYEEALWVADLSDTHLCLLNKFNVLERHVLLVTRAFEDQQEPLGPADFAALWACLEETGGLCFYNAGAAAGASQRHKHLQGVPLPLGPGDGFPLAARLGSLVPQQGNAVPRGLP